MESPTYSFMEVLTLCDLIDEIDALSYLMDILAEDEYKYTPAQRGSIGTKLKERFITLTYG